MIPKFDTQNVLELACAAQRQNGDYLKQNQSVFDKDGKFMYIKHDNKTLIKAALGLYKQVDHEPEFAVQPLTVIEQDKITAEEIKKYFRRLMFSAIKGDNEFQTQVNSILNETEVASNQIGYVACLPSVYLRDRTRNTFEKRCRDLNDEYLADKDTWVNNKDCEILQCIRSKNFEAFNVDAIVDNKLVSWFSKNEIKIGPIVIAKAKVKDHSNHWLTKKSTTRLNYVKVSQ
jgi:hypothetical protein